MSSISIASSTDMMTTSAMMAFVASDHDDGLCHDHGWARDMAAERRSYPRVANPPLVGTPSSAMQDDIHYAG